MRGTFAAAALLLVTFSGCFSGDDADDAFLDPALRAPLSEPIYDILGHFEARFVGQTGTQLYVDYYLPDLPDQEKAPVILVFTPYQSDEPYIEEDGETGLPTGEYDLDPPYSAGLVERFVPRGYAVAFADVRGNHRAGGCIDQTGPEQWQDGYDYVEWLGTQEWSNGKVGMYGASYDGETQFTTAMMAPPHLATIVPVASVSNQYEWSFYNGVPYEMQPFIGMFSYFTGSAMPSSDPTDAALYPEKLTCQAEQFQAGLDFSGDMTPFWQERDYRPMAGDINASVLHVHGLADWNVRPIHIDPLFNDIQSEKRGIFGLWPHAYPDRGDWEQILIAWYDHWLLGRDNGILDILPPVLIEDSQGAWHGMESFPPTEQEWLTLELSADGALVAPGEAQEGELALHDYPEEVLTGIDPTGERPTVQAGQAVMGDYPTELVFSFIAEEDLRLVGRPTLAFTATSSAESTHWAVQLRIDGDTRCEYTFRNDTRTQSVCANTGYQDTRHRDGLQDPKPLTPGEPYDLMITMYPQYDVVPAGSTVELVIRNHDAQVQQDPTNSHNVLHLGGETPALLHLPLAPAETDLPHDELPAIYPGYMG